MSDIPIWMKDPIIAHIPKEKLLFFHELIQSPNNLSKDKMLPFIMQIIQKAKASNISFTKEEMTLLITTIKKYSSENERNTIDKMMAYHSKNNKK